MKGRKGWIDTHILDRVFALRDWGRDGLAWTPKSACMISTCHMRSPAPLPAVVRHHRSISLMPPRSTASPADPHPGIAIGTGLFHNDEVPRGVGSS